MRLYMTHKETTKESYEIIAEKFRGNVAQLAPHKSIEKFLTLLPEGGKILDLGCGSGRDAKIFSEKGYKTIGIDFCPSLIAIAKETAPLAEFQIMDFEDLNFEENSFDGAWAGVSLIHLAKSSFPKVLKTIHRILKEHGQFYITLKKGTSEGLEEDTRYEGCHEKFCAYYQEEELQNYLKQAGFAITEFALVEPASAYQPKQVLRAFCEKA